MNGVVAAPSARTMASAEVSAAWLTALVAGVMSAEALALASAEAADASAVMSAETMASAQASKHWHAYMSTMASAQAPKHWHTYMSTWLRIRRRSTG